MDTNATMIPFYKERVKEIEKEILAIANNAPYADLSDNKVAYLLTLLNDRKGFLDAMFVVTPEEFAVVDAKNNPIFGQSVSIYYAERIADIQKEVRELDELIKNPTRV